MSAEIPKRQKLPSSFFTKRKEDEAQIRESGTTTKDMEDGSKFSVPSTSSTRSGGVRTRGGRLPPILSRGSAASESKKVFAPTIPQRRVKKEKVQKEENIHPTSEKNGESRNAKRERGRGRGRREYVCLSGALFGSGLAQGAIIKESRDSPSDTPIHKPAFNPVKKRTKREIADEEQRLKESDEYDDSGSDEEAGDLPLILPFKTLLEVNIKIETKQEVKVKSEEKPKTIAKNETVEIKTEVTDESVTSAHIKAEKKPSLDDIKSIFHQDDESQELLLLQFPANMPLEERNVPDDVKEMPSTSAQPPIAPKEINTEEKISVNMMDVEEGFIGKLQLMKSGAVRFVYGPTIMYLEQNKPTFMEELVSITEKEHLSPEMLQLGKITKHLVFSPVIGLK